MLPINGRPLLEYIIEWLRQHGIRDIAINLNYCPDVIVNYFGDGTGMDVRIAYSYENPILGTAGAARKLNGFLGDSPLVVMYGDVLTNMSLSALLAFHEQARERDPRTQVTMGLYHVPNPTEVGLVGLDETGKITRFMEKPRPDQVFTDLANTGVLVIEPDAIKLIPPDTFYDFGGHLFPQLLLAGVSMYGWVIPHGTYLLDIGTPDKYAQAQREWTWCL
jgi:NDP-sugar pyrophosphorylase family protein